MKSSIVLRSALCASFVLALGGCSKLLSSVGVGGADGGAAASGLSLTGLEGEIDIAATAKEPGKPDKVTNLALQVKGNKFRADLPTGIEGADKLGHVYGIIDSDAKKADIVIDNQKEVVEIDLNKVGDQVKGLTGPTATPTKPGASEPPKYPPKVTKTGKTDTVAGYSCEISDIASTEPGDKSKADVCVAQQGVSWFKIPLTGAPAEYAALGELADGSHFPLRAIATAKDGVTEQGRIEVTKVDKKSLDASLFTPPATYKVVDLQTAIQGFMASAMSGAGAAGMTGGAGGFAGHPPPRGLPTRH